MIVHRLRPVEPDPARLGRRARLDVEVVEHLDVIADEADGDDDHVALAVAGEAPNDLADVRLEPWLPRASAPALIGQAPALVAESIRHALRRRAELCHVGRGL